MSSCEGCGCAGAVVVWVDSCDREGGGVGQGEFVDECAEFGGEREEGWHFCCWWWDGVVAVVVGFVVVAVAVWKRWT